MSEDDNKHHAADVVAIVFGAQPARSSESIMADWVRSADAMMHDMGFALRGEHPVFIGIDMAADDDYPRTVPALDHIIYADMIDVPTADVRASDSPPKLRTRTSQLDRLAQSRAAKAAMFARARGAK